jgi:hypothetical protein
MQHLQSAAQAAERENEQPVPLTAAEDRLLQETVAKSGDETGADRREDITVSIMLSQNKVTHVYEMIRAFGSQAQVRFDRRRGGWLRADAIAGKHWREFGVRAADGSYLAGPEHAPLIYASDPRRDSPPELQRRLAEHLSGADERIVRGWLRAARRLRPAVVSTEVV